MVVMKSMNYPKMHSLLLFALFSSHKHAFDIQSHILMLTESIKSILK